MAPMQARKGAGLTSRTMRIHVAVWTVIVLFSVLGPCYLLTNRAGNFLAQGQANLLRDGSSDEFQVEERRRRMATMESGEPSGLKREKKMHFDMKKMASPLEVKKVKDVTTISDGEAKVGPLLVGQNCKDDNSCVEDSDPLNALEEEEEDPSGTEQQESLELRSSEAVARKAGWQRGARPSHSDHNVRILWEQLLMARAFSSMDGIPANSRLIRDLKYRLKENMRLMEDVTYDSELPRGAEDKMKAMAVLLSKVSSLHYDPKSLVKRLKSMLETTESQLRSQTKQSNYLNQLAAKTVPKGLHCLSMRLTVNYNALRLDEEVREASPVMKSKLVDNSLYHYAIFSDNVLAVSVVVNSTVVNAKDPQKHVFHIVTDTMNHGAMKMWFHTNPPRNATIQVQNIDTFKWLNSSYCPALKQLEASSTKSYFFNAGNERVSSNLKYRNPKYLSMLNHLRFYLPEVYPKLEKILFLDDDVVVQQDLTALWQVDMKGKVNGAVETCGRTFHRFNKYLNFGDARIRRAFSGRECGWAYGMNMFDLVEWQKRGVTGIYHKWQRMNVNRTLWKLGTLPPGLLTFHKLTHPLAKSWHVLGLGYNPDTDTKAIESAAVVHYNGNKKPWLEIGIPKFKPYWSKYVNYDHPWLQQCNLVSD